MSIIINPGSGPVAEATEENATENMKHYITDCSDYDWKFIRIPSEDYGEGRYAYLVWADNKCHEIQMPGLALSQVRFMNEDNQDIWDFPRLYVDGDSWVWAFALLDKDMEE